MEHCGGQPNESFINNGKNGSAMTTEVGAREKKGRGSSALRWDTFFVKIYSAGRNLKQEKYKTHKWATAGCGSTNYSGI